ncbi:MAG: AraC family transcriptional regulator [Oceanicaulis sp.]|uniref:AraC family transcriptional regulator n=1 Tax=Glycocaulis sp. TaxID=1969725 RepID=UPI0025C49B04|nr:AraC family transcriptional regulator [Glycocaulis sp.]MCC5982175.1 AraC family transcriptional regulator [Oceanicaulis sp.]MCH8520400.1 AraC family transcriptional regulator [Glycocaulis sp.]
MTKPSGAATSCPGLPASTERSTLPEKVSWFIENRLYDALDLDAIAAFAGASRFHLLRAFSAVAGRPLMRHVRARRLSEAARTLAEGAPDIISVAFEAGYSSHEAFTRAFREQFGVTPDDVRKARTVDGLELVEPFRMTISNDTPLAPPRMERRGVLLLAGLGARYSYAGNEGIPAQWGRFAPHIGHVPGQVGDAAYGVCCNFDDAGHFDYVCAVEVKDFEGLPAEFTRLRVPAQHYGVFTHSGHVSALPSTIAAIWGDGLSRAGLVAADAPTFERYGPQFDPMRGEGGVEIWVPVEA